MTLNFHFLVLFKEILPVGCPHLSNKLWYLKYDFGGFACMPAFESFLKSQNTNSNRKMRTTLSLVKKRPIHDQQLVHNIYYHHQHDPEMFKRRIFHGRHTIMCKATAIARNSPVRLRPQESSQFYNVLVPLNKSNQSDIPIDESKVRLEVHRPYRKRKRKEFEPCTPI
jgi:hypothetical protein